MQCAWYEKIAISDQCRCIMTYLLDLMLLRDDEVLARSQPECHYRFLPAASAFNKSSSINQI